MPGPQELLIIAVVALLVFGPDRLPEMMRSAGRLVARFREQSQQSINELRQAAEFDEVDQELRELRRELKQTSSSMSEELRSTTAATQDALHGAGGSRDTDEQVPDGADLAPPPMDPEAT